MTDSLILIGVLAIAIERFIEPIKNFLKKGRLKGDEPEDVFKRRSITTVLGISAGIVVAVPANIDVISSLAGASVYGGNWITAFIIGLGSAPVHEIVKYVEEKKGKAQEEKKSAKAKAEQDEIELTAAKRAKNP